MEVWKDVLLLQDNALVHKALVIVFAMMCSFYGNLFKKCINVSVLRESRILHLRTCFPLLELISAGMGPPGPYTPIYIYLR